MNGMGDSAHRCLQIGRDLAVSDSEIIDSVRRRLEFNRAASLPPGVEFSPGIGIFNPARLEVVASADVVHLHWIDGFVDLERFFRDLPPVPVVHTVLDMTFMTGGCRYALGCSGYKARCGNCPQLQSKQENDLSREIFNRRQDLFSRVRLHMVAPNEHMAAVIRNSAIFASAPVSLISLGVDQKVFHPRNRAASRAALGITDERPLILIGGAYESPRKRIELLVEVLRTFAERGNSATVVALGRIAEEVLERIPLALIRAGYVSDDDAIAELMSGVDVMLCASAEESFGLLNAEAISCAVPIIAFHAPGVSEMVMEGGGGIVVADNDVDAMAYALESLLAHGDPPRAHFTAKNEVLRRFSLEYVTQQYQELYRSLLNGGVEPRSELERERF